jgi:hypothetical protein
MDLDADLQDLKIPSPVKNAIILYKGELTEPYRYLEDHLKEAGL